MSEQAFFGFLIYSFFHLVMITAYPLDTMGFVIKAPKDEPLLDSVVFVLEDIIVSALTFGFVYLIWNFLFRLVH